MGLRVAKPEDFDIVFSMAMKFANAIDTKELVKEDKIKALITTFLGDPNGERIIFVYDDIGFLAAFMQPFMLGHDLTATEVAWWVDPEHRKSGIGKELIEIYELWAKEAGAKLASVACYDDGIGSFYEKLNYRLYERAYIKEL